LINIKIKELIKSIYHKHKGRYGYRRITDELNNQGMVINHKTVLRLMKLLGLKSLIRLKKYKSYKGEQGKIAPNVLKEISKQLNQSKWVI
jgi:transposase InsO family protein